MCNCSYYSFSESRMTVKEKSVFEMLLEEENNLLREKIQEHVIKIQEMQQVRKGLETTIV